MNSIVDEVKSKARADAVDPKTDAKRDVSEEIAVVERRIALRRERLKRDAEEAKLEAQRKAKPLPIIGLVLLAGVGFLIARATRSPASDMRNAYVHAYRPVMARGWREPVVEVVKPRRASTIGKIAAVTGAALRFGMSPQARMLWNAFQRRRHPRGA